MSREFAAEFQPQTNQTNSIECTEWTQNSRQRTYKHTALHAPRHALLQTASAPHTYRPVALRHRSRCDVLMHGGTMMKGSPALLAVESAVISTEPAPA